MEAPPIDDSGYAEEEYYYNYQGQRTMKKNSSVWTEYFYSGSSQLFTSNHLDDMLTENILTPGGRIVASQRFDAGVADGWNFYTNDVRNSTTAILDADGTPVKQYTYDEFGNKTESGSLLNEITYTGAVSDSNTGLYYMNADRF